ncbi:MAG: Do family serine endopeptidase [Spirochaetota bacterium]
MSMLKKLHSRNFFVFNLVLVGILLGFGLAFTGFSCSTAKGPVVKAETPPASAPLSNVAASGALQSALAIQDAFRSIADNVLPAIVELNVVENAAPQPSPGDQQPFRFFFGQPEDNSHPPQDFQSKGLGSGIIVRREGDVVYVLTNNHVAGAATEISAVLSDGREFKAELVGHDDRKDLALVKFTTKDKDIRVATLGDSSTLHVGDWAIAMGSPFGYVSSMTVGIVSALGRTGGPEGNISDFIQTDASINKGNSGGALVNIAGEVIGMNTWIASPTGTSVGLGFSIPINNAKKAIDDFISKKQVEYGWLGVSLREPDKATADDLGVDPKKGAFVAHVFNASPAAKAGLLPGDFIVKIEGRDAKGQSDVVRVVGDLAVGKSAAFTVVRDGKKVDLTARIEVRDAKVAANDGNVFPGVDVVSLASEDIDKSKLPSGAIGALVVNVIPKSMAAIAGIKPGDIITSMGGSDVKNVRDFYRDLNQPSAKTLSITVNRDGESVTLAYARK